MTLYEIDEQIRNCIRIDEKSAVDTLTGEIIDLKQLDELTMERSQKIKNIALWYKNLVADAKALKDEETAFAIRRKTAENKAEQLKSYLQTILNGEKVKDLQFAITWRKSQAVQIDNEKCIPAEFRIPQPDKIDKSGIRNALKNGESIAGAELVERNNIQIK